MHPTPFRRHRATPWALGISLLPGACGGGSDGDGDGDGDNDNAPTTAPPAVVGSATGVLTDAAVQGVAYSASPSGAAGTTDAQGRFRCNPGDSVSVTLGGLMLGAVPAAALLTPIALAAGNTKLRNLLVLLQSLDQDGMAGNGITIRPATAAGVTAGVDLAQAPAGFSAAGNTALAAAMAAGGIRRAITSGTAANAHFLGQATQLLASQVWVGQYDAATVVGLQRFGGDGTQLNVQFGAAEDGGPNGLAYGSVRASAVDAGGFEITTTMEIDTNGTWGLSHLSPCERIAILAGQLTCREAPASRVTDRSTTLAKAENEPGGLVGVWAVGSATAPKTQTVVFWKDGRCTMRDPLGDTTPATVCDGPGVEYGTYSDNAGTQALKVLTVSVDTHGCTGLSDPGITALASLDISIHASGNIATIAGEASALFRVSQ